MVSQKLIDLFRRYYRENNIDPPELISKREVGYMTFSGEVIRHLKINNRFELNMLLRDAAPMHVYSSAAYYRKPDERKMPEKEWGGADLIFDLDSDHLPGSEKLSQKEMLIQIRDQTERLVSDFLIADFGIPKSSIKIYFSGNRGYHVHISDDRVYRLGSDARREITDYITGNSLDETVVRRAIDMLGIASGGWPAVVSKELGEASPANQRRESDLRKAIKRARENHSVLIDSPVTYDIHRIIRMPNTLHGKSGLIVKEVEIDHLGEFDPFQECIPDQFRDGEYDVFLPEKIKPVEIGGIESPKMPGKHRVKTFMAVYLVASGRAVFP
ncbi:DNA primase small subunit PriS [Thermoplasma acidophilum]|uniref:DNA primase small subunit PriS n=1 Tax=Thermoplasma acidophilum TaxID=2303 RepID=UPI00001660AB|nr:DNA primase small subunit PriS [Thermoplasma acidophilum]